MNNMNKIKDYVKKQKLRINIILSYYSYSLY